MDAKAFGSKSFCYLIAGDFSRRRHEAAVDLSNLGVFKPGGSTRWNVAGAFQCGGVWKAKGSPWSGQFEAEQKPRKPCPFYRSEGRAFGVPLSMDQ